MTYDPNDAEHVAQRKHAADQRKRLLDDAFRWLMGDARGRRLMWQRLGESGVFRTSFDPNPQMTAFAEGRRDLGLRDLAQVMRLCPEQYARMAAENSQTGDDDDRRDHAAAE